VFVYFVVSADSGQMSSTMCALSSVARLSVSMTMLMSSGAHRRRLYVDGLVGGGSTTSQAGNQPGEDLPTPPPPQQSNRAGYHRHLWKTNARRAAAASVSSTSVGRALAHRAGGRLLDLGDLLDLLPLRR